MPPQEKESGNTTDPYREVPPLRDEAILRAGEIQVPPPPRSVSEATPPIREEAPSLSPIRTYKSDTAEAVKEKRETVSSIVTAEQARRESGDGAAAQTPEESFVLGFHTKTGAFLALFAGVAFSVGVGLVSFLFLWQGQETEITPEALALVYVNKEIKIDAGNPDRAALVAKVKDALATKGLLLNDLVAITFVRKSIDPETRKTREEMVGVEEMLSRLANEVPLQLLRALGDEYLYGIHVLGDNVPFLIVKVRSYENAFAGMFAWAKTITRDVAVLFNITRFTPPEIYEFSDILIKNRDVGVLYDKEKIPIIYYSFVDRETLILTTDRATFEELLNRLATPKRTLR